MVRERRSSFLPRASAPAALLLLAALSAPVKAQPADLTGTWSGGGSVAFGGGRETARCRAQYTRTSGRSYILRAICATPSGRASQTATLRHVGGSTYQGSFFNREYNVSGSIYVVVRGSRQSVRLTSDAGFASFELHR